MDPHPLSARGVAALALALAGCGDNVTPEVAQPTVEVAALPVVSSKDIDVVIVVATADPARFAAAEPDPSRMVFAVIAGPAQPFSVVERTPPGGVPALALDHSCGWTGPDGLLVADPAVRMADAVDEVGVHGVFTIVCDQNLISQLAQIVSVAQQMFGIACLHEAAPHCTVTEERDGDARELSECPAADDCFEIVPDPDRCGTVNDLRLNVQYATPPTDTTYIRARCEVP